MLHVPRLGPKTDFGSVNMKRILSLIILSAMSSTALAEVIYCRFNDSFKPSSFATWKTKSRTLKTTVGRNKVETMYTDVRLMTGLKPYKKTGFSLIVFGDVPALHLKETNRATLPGQHDIVYVWEAYWGEVPGRLHSNWFETHILKELWGPRGVCWSKEHPPRRVQLFDHGHDDHNGRDRDDDHDHHGHCHHRD